MKSQAIKKSFHEFHRFLNKWNEGGYPEGWGLGLLDLQVPRVETRRTPFHVIANM